MLRSLRRFPLGGGGEIKPHHHLHLHLRSFPSSLSSSTPITSSPPLSPASPAELESLVLRQYRGGKFHALLSSVISHPSVLLAASLNLASHDVLLESVLRRLSIPRLSADLRTSAFDVDSCCVRIVPSRKRGEARVLPNLNLKVVMEAVRMTLGVVYEKRFVTLSYGGRVGMGRHTAVRYLKNSVVNPSWWFRVGFRRQRFGKAQVSKLVELMEGKIDDTELMTLIERFFASEAVAVEVGGVEMGKGFPQESGLSSILMNVYFDGFDHFVQDFRLEVRRKHPRIVSEGEEEGFQVRSNPVRVYAVRYFDDVLLVTSGSKMLMIDIHDKVVRFLERNLCLSVDILRTSIHSAVSEKVGFLGMELQAVPPSVLHPPVSEKAMRAQKMYLKRKAAKALELKNARETRRKKLGLKILSHVFRKLKRVDGFKFEFRIEKEVGEIFRGWAEDVVKEFLGSKEECWNLHRALTSGDFLKLKKIRGQLPTELVESYDLFQEKVDLYLMHHYTSRPLENDDPEESGEGGGSWDDDEAEEEKRYAKRAVEDLTTLCMRVNAPADLVRKAVKMAGFTNSKGRPRPIKLLICLEDSNIIKWYAGVGKRWLDYFCCCRNFKFVKTVVNYHLRFSCFLTLAEKHESTKLQAIKHYTKDLKVSNENGEAKIYFPTEREIKMMGDKNLADPKPVDSAICLILVKLASNETSCHCVGHFCERTDVALYRVRLLQNRLNVDPQNERKWVSGLGAIDECLNKKCLPLCSEHANDLYLGRISLQDVDCTSFVDV